MRQENDPCWGMEMAQRAQATKQMAERPLRAGIYGLLVVALLLRMALVRGGGQYFWPDENRYLAAQDACAKIACGHIRAGLTSLVAPGDHVGFKLLGLLPAALERLTGVNDPRLAATFFALFSWTGLIFLWQWARRIGATLEAQALTLLLAVSCTTLTYYSRHLLPYDPSLALALAALMVGAKQPASPLRIFAAGALVGCAVLVYLGYWLIGGMVLVLLCFEQKESGRQRVFRGMAASLGFASALLAVWLLDQWGEGMMIANARKFSGSITQGDFGIGYRLVWEYFWHAEGPAMLLWIVAAVYAGRRSWDFFRGRCVVPPAWWLSGLALVLLYSGMVLSSDAMNKFVVYGRSARQLAPFFCLTGGLTLADYLSRHRRRQFLAWIIGSAVVVNATWHLEPVVTQVFPRDFRRLGEARLAVAPSAEPGRSYYRYVNVDHYLFEPEELSGPPAATLLAQRHPYEFAPYLYEGTSEQQRARRRAADQRMRLVLVRPPEAELVGGEPYGMITMRVRFAANRAGMAEPVLSLGPRDNGDLFFVRYLSDHDIVFGLESVGAAVLTGEPVRFEPGREYTLQFFNGSLLPPAATEMKADDETRRVYFQNLVRVRLDGREVLAGLAAPHVVRPGEAYAGYNFVRAGSAGTAFSGSILGVQRGGYPPLPTGELGHADYGAARMVAWLPGSSAGVPEPLLVVGVPGHATLVYVRVLPGGRAKFGAEFWGVGSVEGETFAAPSDTATEIIIRLPDLYPPAGDPRWGAVPRAVQEVRRARLTILLNGRVALDRAVMATTAGTPVVFGENPVGGSLVYQKFTGRLVHGLRLELAEP